MSSPATPSSSSALSSRPTNDGLHACLGLKPGEKLGYEGLVKLARGPSESSCARMARTLLGTLMTKRSQ